MIEVLEFIIENKFDIIMMGFILGMGLFAFVDKIGEYFGKKNQISELSNRINELEKRIEELS